jgi:hypothetical protein
MAGRTRSTKKLSQRIDRRYFKKSFPIPHWRRVLSVALTAVGLVWIGWTVLAGKPAYNAGPVAHAHKLVGNDCKSCHEQSSLWGTKTSDKACLTCHDAPVHQAAQTFTPECTECHVEHQGSFKLAATPNATCTQCHSELKVKDGKTNFAVNVKSFSDGHPEFAAVKAGHAPDPGTIKLNHQIHLKKDLRGADGKPVQLLCEDCHHSNLAAPRVRPAVSNVDAAAMTSNIRSVSPEMTPATFERDCKSCHPLEFDKRFKDPAPHKDAKEVDAYVREQYTTYIAQHPNEIHEQLRLNQDLPARPVPAAPRNAAEWVNQRTEEAERLLWQKDCKECHQLTYPAPMAAPEIPKANTTTRWMKNAWFDHKAHQLVACAECHTDAPKSQKTEDVLLPNIATCQKCHNDSANAAAANCSECHVYHDWSKAKPVKSTATISELKR